MGNDLQRIDFGGAGAAPCADGKDHLRLQYGLWALVLVRLLLPVSLGGTAWSVLNVPQDMMRETEPAVTSGIEEGEAVTPELSVVVADSTTDSQLSMAEPDTSFQSELPRVEFAVAAAPQAPERMAAVMRAVTALWIVGAVSMGLWLLWVNVRFARRLRRSRVPLTVEHCPRPVFVTGAAQTPCLFGLFHPCIYVTQEVAADKTVLRHSLAYELTHFRHGDHIWAALRGLCLALHWYNPLVWLAAILSRRDGELCCDEATVKKLGEGERAAYGRTLLAVTCQGRTNSVLTATSMTGSGSDIKERILLLTKRPETAVYTLAAVALISALAVGCTFTGAQVSGEETDLDSAEEVTLVGLAVEASGGEEEIGRQWAETFAAQYRNLSPNDLLYSTDSAVLECTPYAKSLLSQPREQIYLMRFACHAVDDVGFEQWYTGGAGPLTGEEYPQYEGWMEFGWFIVLEEQQKDRWGCINAGSGGYGNWGYLNNETAEIWEQILKSNCPWTAARPTRKWCCVSCPLWIGAGWTGMSSTDFWRSWTVPALRRAGSTARGRIGCGRTCIPMTRPTGTSTSCWRP